MHKVRDGKFISFYRFNSCDTFTRFYCAREREKRMSYTHQVRILLECQYTRQQYFRSKLMRIPMTSKCTVRASAITSDRMVVHLQLNSAAFYWMRVTIGMEPTHTENDGKNSFSFDERTRLFHLASAHSRHKVHTPNWYTHRERENTIKMQYESMAMMNFNTSRHVSQWIVAVH